MCQLAVKNWSVNSSDVLVLVAGAKAAPCGVSLRPRCQWIRCQLRIAADGIGFGIRTGAQRSEVVLGVWNGDESHRSGSVFAVERSRFGYVKHAAIHVRVIRIVEPESEMKRIDRAGIALIRIKTKDLIQQDRLDGGLERALVAGLQIRLVPRHSEVREAGVHGGIGQQVAALYGEHVKRQAGFEVVAVDGQSVIGLTAGYSDAGCRRRPTSYAQTTRELRVGMKHEGLGVHHGCGVFFYILSCQWLYRSGQTGNRNCCQHNALQGEDFSCFETAHYSCCSFFFEFELNPGVRIAFQKTWKRLPERRHCPGKFLPHQGDCTYNLARVQQGHRPLQPTRPYSNCSGASQNCC